ncbi:uncharacterized protein I303_107257 [Kwoniella dejecticola CBS 10117]|uniref:Arginase n=1 Tax=Kwoniella dejecticola CBS 10117 TaxID=1296121 RepID=A0A1A5ZZ91_9TREE|nr:uncharacterized protein I303_06659 [Kwoniella dejecticola CBS 10117]OBR83100.1 hypothetical protein I303_06659 [Kwoniella dejecticola CBS 10117]
MSSRFLKNTTGALRALASRQYTSIPSAAGKRTNSYGLLHYAGRSGDHNDKAVLATPILTSHLSSALELGPIVIGQPEKALNGRWKEELQAALPNYHSISRELNKILLEGKKPVIALSRCSVALATLPIIAKHTPDVVVVWFDAHGDLNTPENSSTGFLGGMALSGPVGLWDPRITTDGKNIREENVILVGSRDLDECEKELIDQGKIKLIAPTKKYNIVRELVDAAKGKKVFIHLDCDVLEPGMVPTDYKVPNGLSLQQLQSAIQGLAESCDVLGIELSELEYGDNEEQTQMAAETLVDTIKPLLA